MKAAAVAFVLLLSLSVGLVAGDWNILNYITKKNDAAVAGSRLDYELKHYCKSWQINVEVHNIRGLDAIPDECVGYVRAYLTSTQYSVDVQRDAEECILFLANAYHVAGDGKDAWIFDLDDVLLSTVPYYKGQGGSTTNRSSLEAWMGLGNAPALEHMLPLFQGIRAMGLKAIVLSSTTSSRLVTMDGLGHMLAKQERNVVGLLKGSRLSSSLRLEYQREATVDNLIRVGYHGWTELILKS